MLGFSNDVNIVGEALPPYATHAGGNISRMFPSFPEDFRWAVGITRKTVSVECESPPVKVAMSHLMNFSESSSLPVPFISDFD